MSSSAVPDGSGIEAWCDECGSIAYWPAVDDDWEATRKAEAAALLHEDNDCAPIWLDDQGEPTIVNTGRWAGGCSNLLEWGEANVGRPAPSPGLANG